MALTTVLKVLKLDVFNYENPIKITKAIAYDENTRVIGAKLYNDGVSYEVDADATVTLYVIRPDNVGVIVQGSVDRYERDIDDQTESDVMINGVCATLTPAALCLQGNVRAQFKIEYGSDDNHQILRTEIFIIKNGEALDASTDDWSGTYHGVPLDELIEQLEDINSNLAPLYNSESSYAVGDYVMHDNKLYKCTTAISTAEDWDVSHWERCSVMSELMPDINFEQVSF